MKIVIAEKVSAATLAVFASEPSFNVVTHDQIKNGLAAEVADADALIVRSAVQADAALMEAAPKLRVIGRAGVGVDNIDADAATRHGIVVMNTPGANAIAVAELTLGVMLALARSIPRANATMHGGKWEKKSLQGAELRGKTMGILGLGRIGLEVARRARSFGMEVVGHDPFVSQAVARENEVQLLSMDDLFARADYLSLHVGLTKQTEGIINADSLKKLKKGVRIINCARGELIVDTALAEALKSGHVAGAALDVFREEPLKDSAYFDLDNVVLTPHIAGSTAEAQEAVGVQIAMQVKEYLKSGVVQNAVNVASMTHEEYAELSPYITMAERLGAFLANASQAAAESIHFSYLGRLAEAKTQMVRNGAIAGVLAQSESVNRINAASVAEERGIRLHEERKEAGYRGAGSILKMTIHTQAGTHSGSATVLHGTQPRLLAYDGIDIEAPLQGTLICIRNRDVPGVIGRVGTVLGDMGVNIANFALGRGNGISGSSGQALAVIQVDAKQAVLTAQMLDALRAIEAVTDVRLVELPTP